MESDLTAILKEEGLTGISWMTITPREGTQIAAIGFSKATNPPAPYSPDMQFHVGSVTKTVLATGVLKLVAENKIDLDKPIKAYLPELAVSNPWRETNPITTRHILDHTAGIEDARFWQVFSERPNANTPLVDALVSSGLKVRTRPGSRFSYSNTGYTVAAMVIEAITGQRYETYLDEHLLRPLGMRDSTFGFTTQEGQSANEKLVWGHFDDGIPTAAASVFLRPASQFTSTSADMARLANFLMSDGTGIINPGLMKARGRPRNTESSSNGLTAGYALGIARRDRHGSIGFCHTGSIIGFYAILCVYPDQQKAFFYSVNTDSEVADYGRLAARLVESLNLNKPTSPITVSLPEDASDWTGFYKISPTRFDLFHYVDTVFGMRWVNVNRENTGLTLGGVQARDRYLLPVGGSLYRATDRSSTSHVFYTDDTGMDFLDDGFRSHEKVSKLFALAHFAIVILGLLGMGLLVPIGLKDLFRKNNKAPSVIALTGLAILALPLPLFFLQSFMSIGDLTMASAGVALTTGLLPVFMLAAIIRTRMVEPSPSVFLTRWSATFVCLWWLVMILYGQMPLMLWS